MKAGRALVFHATLLVSTPLFADTALSGVSARCTASTVPAISPASDAVNPLLCSSSPYYHDIWGRCPAFPAAAVLPLPQGSPAPKQQPVFIAGEQLEGGQHGESVLTGNVQLDQGDRRITAGRITYNTDSGQAHVEDHVQYLTPQMSLSSPKGDYDTRSASGNFSDANFLLPQRHGHGSAQQVTSLDQNRSQLLDVRYSTCPVGSEDWYLSAPDMLLDESTNTGIAHDVTVDFLGVPIFWSPYLNFPLSDDRKSGLLSPAFSYSNATGFDVTVPYYLNLADNYDATLIPRVIGQRGLDMGGQFRYLTPNSSGELDVNYLSHDRIADRERALLSYSHDTRFSDHLDFNADYNWVSDPFYFQDLGSSLTAVATSIEERHLRLSYDDRQDWTITTQLQDFQLVNPLQSTVPLTAPYRLVPQTVLQWQNNDDLSGPQYAVYGELVRFQRDGLVGTWRADLKPSVSLPLSASGGYFTPTLAWRYTDYEFAESSFTNPALADPLTNPQGQETLASPHLARSTPIFSLDSGLFLDRDTGDYVQTLEPRIYYLRVPYRDQSQLPIFDSVQPDFNYLQLFTDNRFYGADRQGDANQVSYALTSRLLDSNNGSQVFEADLGQIRYFSRRRVQLNATTPVATGLFSDVVADVAVNLNQAWSLGYNELWSPVTRQEDLRTVILGYHPAYREALNLAYRFNSLDAPQTVQQTDISFVWPLSNSWSVVGRRNYDLLNHQTLEDFIGFEYDSCCWNFQILHRRYITATGIANNTVFFELQLKGLAAIGRHLEDFLQNGILGYSDTSTPP